MSTTATTLQAEPLTPLHVTASKPDRIVSVDMLRGLTIALMILVNDPGDGAHTFAPLEHAAWTGWTLTDLVFPTFLFLVGASTVFSLEARERRGDCWKTLTGHIVWRAAKLFLLKTALSLVPYFHWHTMRVYGVLTRIAVCYLLGGLVLLLTRRLRMLAVVTAALLVGYWVLLRWVPVPGAGMPVRDFVLLDRVQNLAAWMDRGVSAWTLRWLHTGPLYLKTSDPEGLLSTLPALATTLLGAMAGLWMRRPREWGTHWLGTGVNGMRSVLAVAGAAGVAAGLGWGHWFPINKNLWTSSYVLLAAGWSALGLACCSALVDARPRPWPKWLQVVSWPWMVFGANAMAAYTASVVVVKLLLDIKVHGADGRTRNLWGWTYLHGFSHGHSNEWTSLAFGLCFMAVCFLPNWWMWRRKIFWKI